MTIINNDSTLDLENDLNCLLDTIKLNLNAGLKKIVSNISKKVNDYDETFNAILTLPIFKDYIEKINLLNNENIDHDESIANEINNLKHIISTQKEIILIKNKENASLTNVIIKLKTEINELKMKNNDKNEEHISLKIEETITTIDKSGEEEEEEVEEEEEEVEEEVEEEEEEKEETKKVEEKVEVVEEEEEEVELVEEEEEEEEEVEVVEEEEEEVEVVEEEEEEVEEVEVVEEEVEEVEEVEVEEEEEEEEEVYEIEIDDILYFTNNDENGEIYKIDSDGNPGDVIGHFKNGEPIFL
jgi:hypothetical protein